MGKYVADRAVKMMIAADIQVRKARVAVLGLSFKEKRFLICATRALSISSMNWRLRRRSSGPWSLADAEEARSILQPWTCFAKKHKDVDAVVLAVAHRKLSGNGSFRTLPASVAEAVPILLDIKSIFETGNSKFKQELIIGAY